MIKVILPYHRAFVSPASMKLGQVGRITKWGGSDKNPYVGTIVVRGYDTLYSADFNNMAQDKNWNTPEIFGDIASEEIELFPAGTKIEITL